MIGPSFRPSADAHLHPGPECEDHRLYASHAMWDSCAAFETWTRSENFRKARAQRNAPKGTYLGHPELELFESVA